MNIPPDSAWQPDDAMSAIEDKPVVLSLSDLRTDNISRQEAWCAGGDPKPDLSFRGIELAGEVGEALNVIKKLERERHGWRGSRATLDDLADELADVIICADLAAEAAGVDLAAAVIRKFNATSEKVGLPQRLSSATVEALKAEIARKDAQLSALKEETRKVLEPFVDAAIAMDYLPNAHEHKPRTMFTIGHLRAARSLADKLGREG